LFSGIRSTWQCKAFITARHRAGDLVHTEYAVLLSASPTATAAPPHTSESLCRLALRILLRGTTHTLHRRIRIGETAVTVCRFVCGARRHDTSAMSAATADAPPAAQPGLMRKPAPAYAVPRLPLVALHPFRAGASARAVHAVAPGRPLGWDGWVSERGARVRRQWYYSGSMELKPSPPHTLPPTARLIPVRPRARCGGVLHDVVVAVPLCGLCRMLHAVRCMLPAISEVC
jgi:hypothetical protein